MHQYASPFGRVLTLCDLSIWRGMKESGSELCEGNNGQLMSAKLPWPQWLVFKWISGQKLKNVSSHYFFHFPFALRCFEFAATRVSKVEACWHAQDINGRAREWISNGRNKKWDYIHFLLVSAHFLKSKLCRIIYDSWRDAWRQVGCSLSDSCGEWGNRVWVHIFFDSGNIAVASTEHGRKPQRTGATALAKRGWCCISVVMGSTWVKVWWLVWCRGRCLRIHGGLMFQDWNGLL